LPQDFIDNHKPDANGRIKLTTDYPDVFPVLQFAQSDTLRRSLYDAFNSRAYPKNRDVLRDMMQTRYQIAKLVGYASWADYNAADKMMVNGGNIAKFIQQLDAASRPIAQREYAMLLAEKRKSDPAAKEILSYEGIYYSELVRRSQFNFDSQTVRPYLPYHQVKQGILDTAATLFHVSFRQEVNAPAWDPSVETWDVIENGKAIGRFYLDMHPRPGKYSHDQMSQVLDGVRGEQLPEAILVCNFPKPTASDPGLMDYDDAVTFFHEFGHLMHHILGGQQQWAGISGISMEADFVEAPSQMLENWMRSPQVLASFARNYKTGEPIPADLVAKMNRASAFGRASDVSFQNALAAISYDIYKDAPEKVDLEAVCLRDFRSYNLPIPLDVDGHMYASFNHLGGYSSAYYTYMWDKVIAQDFFQQFDQKNLLAGDAPMRYRHVVLEPGGSVGANDLVKNFLGRPQNMVAFQQWMGEEFEGAPSGTHAGAN
jgi:thimet oligopeptidase